jgi:hypothetical protein
MTNIKDIIVYSVVKVDFAWRDEEARPSIIATYTDRQQAIDKKHLCKQIAILDKAKDQYHVVSIKLDEKVSK